MITLPQDRQYALLNIVNLVKTCLGLLNVANVVANEGYWKMKDAFKCLAEHVQPCAACPDNVENKTIKNPTKSSVSINMTNYSSQHRKRKFLQIPLAAIDVKIGEKESKVFLVDKHANLTLLRSLLVSCLRKIKATNYSAKKLSKPLFKVVILMLHGINCVMQLQRQLDCLKKNLQISLEYLIPSTERPKLNLP